MAQPIWEEPASKPGTVMCPDCPVSRVGVLAQMLPPRARGCAFRCVTLAARAPLPARWFRDYGFGVVRRGMLIRQRIDGCGRAVAVDAVGPGGLVPFSTSLGGEEGTAGGYAISDLLVCVCTTDTMRGELDEDRRAPHDVMRLQAGAMERMERFAEARGRPTVAGRVAAVLCALADGLTPRPRAETVSRDVQQLDLAALVSARHESVCRALRALERRGWIAREGDGIHLVDRRRLEEL